MSTSPRLYALDNLRATMMWLGVVLHAAALHRIEPNGLQWRDPQTSHWAGLLGALIHAFRMPVFFIVAGFFVALLVARRGPAAMLRHRAMRIGVPLLLFWPPLFALLVLLTNLHAQPPGAWPLWRFDLAAVPPTPSGARLQTVHLWFLELLMGLALIAALFYGLLDRIPARVRESTANRITHAMESGWSFLLLAAPLALVDRHHPYGIFEASGDWRPPAAEWLHYGLFFAYGLALYRARARMLPMLQQRVGRHALGGALCFLGVLALYRWTRDAPDALAHPRVWMGLLYNACAWLWCFALIGGFLRFLPRRNPLLAYLAASAYWVYLVHLPMIGVVALALREWNVAFGWKLLANIGATSLICIVSYELLARRTFIATLLNGRPPSRAGLRDGVRGSEPAPSTQ